MTTEREVWLADHPSAPATTCTCGQELDLCHREHCPRCGVRVVAAARGLARTAAWYALSPATLCGWVA